MENRSHAGRFWGKADRQDRSRVHLLEHHLADVGACFEVLLQQPLIRRRLAQTAGRQDLDATTRARLCVLAALHDIGKVNAGFQTQIWDDADFPPGTRRPGRAGHTLDLTPVLCDEDRETAGWFFDALGWWNHLLTWDDRDGATVCGLFVAALSHHGRPLQLDGIKQRKPQIWRPFGALNPPEYARRVGRMLRKWFPEAFAPAGEPLPSAPAFQHHFLGLCNLADWIGSNEAWFAYLDEPRDDYIADARESARQAIRIAGLNVTTQRQKVIGAGAPDFARLFPHIERPNAIQRAAREAPVAEPLVIIESEAGSGKTEAALWRFAELYAAGLVDGLYCALPTRAAAAQIHGRVRRLVARLFPAGATPETVLAVPGYLQAGDVTGHHLQDYQVWWDDHAADGRRWAAESPKRFLAAQVAVGTVDQVLLGSLKAKNAHMRAASLARNLLVVDEVHASDAYMREILAAALDAHAAAGGCALLMSATLGAVARRKWLGADDTNSLADAINVPYPAVSARSATVAAGENGQAKSVRMESRPIMREPPAIAQIALAAARVGAKVLVVRNTVDYAVNAWQAVAELANDEVEILLHHGRYAAADRKHLDACVEALLGKDKRPEGGCVAVGTQTLEQSLDIDADLLITDLCPADVLLQRIGRLHRHDRDGRPPDYAAPQCIVLTPACNDLSPLLAGGRDANGLGPHGGVYEDLRILQATLGLVAEHPQWEIPAMNRELVERATHPSALEAVEAMGDAWKVHGIEVKGGEIGDWQTAGSAVVRRDKSFFADNRETLFPRTTSAFAPAWETTGWTSRSARNRPALSMARRSSASP